MHQETLVLHTGQEVDVRTGAVSVPIYQVSTYRQKGPGEHLGYEYSRTSNPTREALEKTAAALEEGSRGLAFASGLAAINTVFSLFNSGDRFLVSDDVYGGTYRILTKVFSRLGIDADFVDTSDLAAVAAAITPHTRALFIETPTNPLLKVSDIAAAAALAHEHGMLLLVDNTFMTPYWQKPLTLGADVVIHSATKYLGGHSDVVGGLAVTRDEKLGEELAFLQNAQGGILGPFDSWLLLRGIKTLSVRMERHEQNARELAQWLTTRPEVRRVYYPGLPTHPGHELAKRQARGFGGMVSFELQTAAQADRLLRRVRLITLAESLGAVESLINLPAKMTHASIPPERRQELGVTDSLVRLSVGIEHVADLREDILQALRN